MGFFDRIHGTQNIPVHRLGARRGGHGSFINPTVSRVDHVHQFPIRNEGDSGVGLQVPLHLVEKLVDQFNLFFCDRAVIIIHIEDDTPGGISESIGGGLSIVDSVHLEVISLSVNSVFRTSVEMELHSGESVVRAVHRGGHFRFEGLGVLGSFVHGNLGGVTVLPCDSDICGLVSVHLVILIVFERFVWV